MNEMKIAMKNALTMQARQKTTIFLSLNSLYVSASFWDAIFILIALRVETALNLVEKK